MADDPFDRETSIAVAISEGGLEARARSRAISSMDRLLGNVVDALNLPLERHNERQRARIAGEKLLLGELAQKAAEQFGQDPEFVSRAIEGNFAGIFRRQRNKDSVAREAIEQLTLPPPTPANGDAGPEVLSEQFMQRFERFAEEASTEELKQKWARVLVSEIRRPGTFSYKSIRIVDEMDAKTAKLFEYICTKRMGNVIPKILLEKELQFNEISSLVGAELLIDPGVTGQIRVFTSVVDQRGRELWFTWFDGYGLGFIKESEIGNIGFAVHQGAPALDVYILTAEGRSISSILDTSEERALQSLLDILKNRGPGCEFFKLRRDINEPSVFKYI